MKTVPGAESEELKPLVSTLQVARAHPDWASPQRHRATNQPRRTRLAGQLGEQLKTLAEARYAASG